MQGAVTALAAFVDKSCAPTSTRQALPRGVHQARPRARAPGIAGRRLGRLRRGAGVRAAHARRGREGRSRADAARSSPNASDRGGDQAPVVILYRDEVGDEFNARSLSCRSTSSRSSPRRRTRASCTAPTTAGIWGGSAPVGDHVLIVEAVHDCKPGMGRAPARTCARPGRSRAPCTRPSRSRSAPTPRTARATPPPTRPSTSACGSRIACERGRCGASVSRARR